MTAPVLRVVDTGLAPARWNVAATAALAASHRAGTATLRFHRYPPAVLVGLHQALAGEVRVARCAARGVTIARRATGGGAVYMAPEILAFDVVADRQRFGGRLDRATDLLCAGIAEALRGLGLDAFARGNAVIAAGRKVCGTSGLADGPAVVFQASLLLDVDLAAMADVLVAAGDAAALASGVAGVSALLGRRVDVDAAKDAVGAGIAGRLGVACAPGILTAPERGLADRLCAERFGRDDFVAGREAA